MTASPTRLNRSPPNTPLAGDHTEETRRDLLATRDVANRHNILGTGLGDRFEEAQGYPGTLKPQIEKDSQGA